MARLQSEFCTKDLFVRATNFLTKNAPNFSPNILSLCSVGQKNPGKFPPNFPLNFPNFPAKNQKKSPASFCRSAGRKVFHDKGLIMLSGHTQYAVSLARASKGLNDRKCTPILGCTPRGSCNTTLLRRVLRRFFKGNAS